MDSRHHHPHSHLHTAVRTSASALPPTFPVGDHSASKTKTTQRHSTFCANKSMCDSQHAETVTHVQHQEPPH